MSVESMADSYILVLLWLYSLQNSKICQMSWIQHIRIFCKTPGTQQNHFSTNRYSEAAVQL